VIERPFAEFMTGSQKGLHVPSPDEGSFDGRSAAPIHRRAGNPHRRRARSPAHLVSARDGRPTILLLRDDGKPGANVTLDAAGRPIVTPTNPLRLRPAQLGAKLERRRKIREPSPSGYSDSALG